MRILHLFSNSKWTGPAEPALNLCVALQNLGVECHFACTPDAGSAVNKVVESAREHGIHTLLDFHLRKHRHPLKNFQDRLRLRRVLEQTRYDCIHCHLDNAHRIAAGPAYSVAVPLVRSNYGGEGFRGPGDIKRLLEKTAFLIEPSEAALHHDAERYRYSAEQMAVIPGAVDVERFDPARTLPDGRKRLGLDKDDFVIGIVARIQRHRNYDVFFRALRRIMDEHSGVHVVVIGRGTHEEEVAKEPARKMGHEDRIFFTGFLDDDDYVGMVKAFDIKVFLVPGSDGTCRAVREAMAMAKPVIVARRGMLPEIVDDGETGLVFDGAETGLIDAIQVFLAEPRKVRLMGKKARAVTLSRYNLETQARAVNEIYRRVIRD